MGCLPVMIAEDHAAYATGLKSLLEKNSKAKVIGIACDGKALLEQLNQKNPDLIFMDIQMPVMDGIAAMRHIQSAFPCIKVVALTQLEAPQHLLAMMQAGAHGYINKNCVEEDLAECMEQVMQGRFFYCPSTTRRIAHLMAKQQLVLRETTIPFDVTEKQIIKMICLEHENEYIEKTLFLSPSTYHRYLKQICLKMDVKSKAGLMVYAMKHGLDKED